MKNYGWSYLVVLLLIVIGVASWSLYNDNHSRLVSGPTPSFAPGIGGGPGDLVSGSPSAGISPLRFRFQTALTDHGVYATTYLKDLYDGKDTTSDEQSLEINNQEIKDLVSEVGGVQASDEFMIMWRGHATEYANYTKALKSGDNGGTAQVRTNLSNMSIQMGDMIHKLIATVSSEDATGLMNEHIDLTLKIVEDHSKGDTNAELIDSTQASAQAVRFANILTDGIEINPSAAPSN